MRGQSEKECCIMTTKFLRVYVYFVRRHVPFRTVVIGARDMRLVRSYWKWVVVHLYQLSVLEQKDTTISY